MKNIIRIPGYSMGFIVGFCSVFNDQRYKAILSECTSISHVPMRGGEARLTLAMIL